MKTLVFKLGLKQRLTLLIFTCVSMQSFNAFSQNENAKTILERYASDYQNDLTLTKDIIFAVKVDDKFWHIKAKAKTETSEANVSVHEGKPVEPTFYFFTDLETLNKIYKGEINALTASAKAFESDFAPFDVDVMEGFQPDGSFISTLFSVYFHFWTRGMPERIPYGLDLTRLTHGAQASIFYYQPGFRSAYVAVKKGQHANENEKSKSNPFPTLLIAIKGEGTMIINGVKSKLTAGEAIVIPPGTTHEFLNENEAPLECILLMFGEGA